MIPASRSSHARWLLLAVPPGAASMLVLAIGGVGYATWTVQLAAIALAGALALGLRTLARAWRGGVWANGLLIASVGALALPFLRAADGPTRWISLGGMLLYVAPAVLPSAIASFAVLLRDTPRNERVALVAIPVAAALLALQPDASQVVALLAACGVQLTQRRRWTPGRLLALGAVALLAAWSFTRPDPLQPVPHVEGVFALALGRSIVAGLAVILAAVAFVVGVARSAGRNESWHVAVATYYAALFACSVAGLTPAPLIGYGAGPWLGFGMLAGVARGLEVATDPAP